MAVSSISDEPMPTFRTESTKPQSSEPSQSSEQQAQLDKIYAEMHQHALEIRDELFRERRAAVSLFRGAAECLYTRREESTL